MTIYRRDTTKQNTMMSVCGKFRVVKVQFGMDYIYVPEYLRETTTKSGYMAQSWTPIYKPCKTFEAAKQQIEEHRAMMGGKYAV